MSPPEIRTCTRVVQGLAPVQLEEKLQRRESVIRPTCGVKVKGKIKVVKRNILEPVPEELPAANDAGTIIMTEAKSTLYGVTLTQRQPTTDNTPEKASKVKTTTWWLGPRCTTWWSNCPQMKGTGDLTNEHNSTSNAEIVSGASKDMVVQYSQLTDTPTNGRWHGECGKVSMNGRQWIKMVERIENKRIESIRKEKSDKIREKLKQQIKNVLLSTEEDTSNKDTNRQSLPKNCQLYRFVCPKC